VVGVRRGWFATSSVVRGYCQAQTPDPTQAHVATDLRLLVAQSTHRAQDFLLGLFAHTACIQQDHLRFFGGFDGLITLFRKQRQDLLGVVNIHLAAKRMNIDPRFSKGIFFFLHDISRSMRSLSWGKRERFFFVLCGEKLDAFLLHSTTQ
jgi:hypothetical protein